MLSSGKIDEANYPFSKCKEAFGRYAIPRITYVICGGLKFLPSADMFRPLLDNIKWIIDEFGITPENCCMPIFMLVNYDYTDYLADMEKK